MIPYCDLNERGGYDSDELDALAAGHEPETQRGPRFVVLAVTGYESIDSHGGQATFGLSAHVCDTLNAYLVVRTYRSSDRVGNRVNHRRIGDDEAKRLAHEHAERLNRDTA